MAHWGWCWKVKKKHVSRTVCSSFTTIDSFKMFKKGVADFSVSPLSLTATLIGDQLHMQHGKSARASYVIQVEKQPCHFGGFRYFFHCPLCQKRMRILYFAQKSIFLCRGCLNLCYDTQRLRSSHRHSSAWSRFALRFDIWRVRVILCNTGDCSHSLLNVMDALHRAAKGKPDIFTAQQNTGDG